MSIIAAEAAAAGAAATIAAGMSSSCTLLALLGLLLSLLPALHTAPCAQPGEHDYELIVEYIDAIRHLTAAAQAPHPDKEEIQRLSRMVLHIQQVRRGLRGAWALQAGCVPRSTACRAAASLPC